MIRVNVKRQVAPIQSQSGQTRILHGWRRRMANGMSKDRAKARAGIDCIAGDIGHVLFIGQGQRNSKLQSGRMRGATHCGRGSSRITYPNFTVLIEAGGEVGHAHRG